MSPGPRWLELRRWNQVDSGELSSPAELGEAICNEKETSVDGREDICAGPGSLVNINTLK